MTDEQTALARRAGECAVRPGARLSARLLRVLRYARLTRWGREDTRRFWTRYGLKISS